jgi:hypothetical protein
MATPGSETNVKAIVIKGGAAEDYYKSKGLKRSGKRSTRKIQHGGDEPPSPAIALNMGNAKSSMNIVRQSTPSNSVSKMIGGSALPSAQTTLPGTQPQNPAPLTPANIVAKEVGTVTAPLSLPNPNAPKQEGGASKSGGKLILSGKKSRSKLILAPPSGKKKTRKLRVQLTGMKKRITRAKSIHKESKEKSIEEIRTLLEESKLIKPATSGKKVPDEILRNIYRDYMLLRGRAL